MSGRPSDGRTITSDSTLFTTEPSSVSRVHTLRRLGPTRCDGKGKDLQLTPVPTADGLPPPLPSRQTQLWRLDGGHGFQGWSHDHATPVLWTEWRLDSGIVVRQEVFSHVPGSGDVQRESSPISPG